MLHDLFYIFVYSSNYIAYFKLLCDTEIFILFFVSVTNNNVSKSHCINNNINKKYNKSLLFVV